MNDRIRRVGRIHLRIKRRNFYGKINDREQLRVFAKRICPAARFATEMLEQFQTTTGVLVRFLFAYDCLAEKIDREPDAWARRLRSIFMTSFGFRPAMNWRAMPDTFHRRSWPLTHGTIFAARTPVRINGA